MFPHPPPHSWSCGTRGTKRRPSQGESGPRIGTQAPCSPLHIPTQDRDPGTLLAAAHTHGLRGAAVSQAPQFPHPQGTRLELHCLKTCYFSLISPGAVDGSEEV